jgi:hypothetical protein
MNPLLPKQIEALRSGSWRTADRPSEAGFGPSEWLRIHGGSYRFALLRCQKRVIASASRSSWNSTADGGVWICVRTLLVAVGVGVLVAGCAGGGASGSSGPSSGGHRGCVSSRALGTLVGVGNRTVRVGAGQLATVWLTEPEAYASGPDDAPPPTAFPWRAPQSSGPTKLSPVAVCKRRPVVTSLPVRLYPFRAINPGPYQISAPLNPTYHIPRMRPPLRPLRPVRVTVLVSDGSARPHAATTPTYTVVAPVLYLTRVGTPMACLAMLESLPPAGCAGVPVSGYDFKRVPGLVRFHAMGWQTRPLRLVGTWNGPALALTRAPIPATAARPEPNPPEDCHGQSTPASTALAKRITRDHATFNMLELDPCGDTVWVLVAVADKATISYIHEHFGSSVKIAGWLQPG